MGFEPVLFDGPPLRLAWMSCKLVSVCVVSPLVLPFSVNCVEVSDDGGEMGRSAIGLDVHRDFCVVAICEDGKVRSGGRAPSTPDGLATLAESDQVALEVTGSCWEVARTLEPHADRVVVVSPDDTGVTQARAKTDRLDGRDRLKLDCNYLAGRDQAGRSSGVIRRLLLGQRRGVFGSGDGCRSGRS